MKLLESEQIVDSAPEFTYSIEGKSSMEGVEINPTDVLCGRGKNSFNHLGNRKFRDIVAEAIPGYVAASSRATKSEIVAAIVRKVRENGGRFLKRDSSRKVWYVLNHTQSKEKAGHAIRDATITEESKKERAKKRKLMRAAAAGAGINASCTPTFSMDLSNMVAAEEALQEAPPVEFEKPVMKDLTIDVKALDDRRAPSESLSSMLMAHFPEKLLPDDAPTSSSFEPLPIDDPFNSYIDHLLGPLIDLVDPTDFS